METERFCNHVIHTFKSSCDAYDATQYSEMVVIGDILHVPSEGVVGIADTWPFAITTQHGQFHKCVDASGVLDDLRLLRPNIDWKEKVEFAVQFAEKRKYIVNPIFNKVF